MRSPIRSILTCMHARTHTHTYIMPSINAPLSSIAHLWKITHALDYFNSFFARKCLGNTLSVCVFVHICTLLDLLLDAGNRYEYLFYLFFFFNKKIFSIQNQYYSLRSLSMKKFFYPLYKILIAKKVCSHKVLYLRNLGFYSICISFPIFE